MDGTFLKEKRKNWLDKNETLPIEYCEMLMLVEKVNVAIREGNLAQVVFSERDTQLSLALSKLVQRELEACKELMDEN